MKLLMVFLVYFLMYILLMCIGKRLNKVYPYKNHIFTWMILILLSFYIVTNIAVFLIAYPILLILRYYDKINFILYNLSLRVFYANIAI